MSEFDRMSEFLMRLPSEVSFLYEIEPVLSRRKYEHDWNRMSRFKLENAFPEVLKRRIEEFNLVNYVSVVGEVGSGKSNTSLWIAKQMQSDFSMKKGLYLGRDVDLSLEYIIEEHEKGDWVVVEEAEIMLSKYRATSLQNRAVKETLDTVRDFGVNFIFNAPSLNALDQHVVDWQIDFNLICSFADHRKKIVHATVEANCRDKTLSNWGYVYHSEIIVPFISASEFQKYQEVKRKILYDAEKLTKTFQQTRRERREKKKKQKTTEAVLKLRQMIDQRIEQSVNKKLSKADKIELAKEGLRLGISKMMVKGMLRVADGIIRNAEAELLIEQARKEREKEGSS